jgi:hypothetical protein
MVKDGWIEDRTQEYKHPGKVKVERLRTQIVGTTPAPLKTEWKNTRNE